MESNKTLDHSAINTLYLQALLLAMSCGYFAHNGYDLELGSNLPGSIPGRNFHRRNPALFFLFTLHN